MCETDSGAQCAEFNSEVLMPDPITIGAAVGALGTYIGSRQQGRRQSKEAQRDRDFQERMSSTAYQRSIHDMEAAELNPALAYQQGGASTPGGSKADTVDEISPSISTALQTKRLGQELKVMKATERETNARARRGEAEALFAEGTNAAYGVTFDDTRQPGESGYMKMSTGRQMPNLMSMIHAQVSSAQSLAAMQQLGLVGSRNQAAIQRSRAGMPLEFGRQAMQTIFGRQLAQRVR